MKGFERFDPWLALNTITPPAPAKVAKAAKAEPDTPNVSDFSDFSGDAPTGPDTPETAGEAERDTRRAWSDALCRRLHATVASACPPGLGRWDSAWTLVEAPSARMLDLLATWEDTGDEADQRAAGQAADAVLHAWALAAARWEAECGDFERWCIEHEDDPDAPTPERWREL